VQARQTAKTISTATAIARCENEVRKHIARSWPTRITFFEAPSTAVTGNGRMKRYSLQAGGRANPSALPKRRFRGILSAARMAQAALDRPILLLVPEHTCLVVGTTLLITIHCENRALVMPPGARSISTHKRQPRRASGPLRALPDRAASAQTDNNTQFPALCDRGSQTLFDEVGCR